MTDDMASEFDRLEEQQLQKKVPIVTVGQLRLQTALCDADRPVILVSDDPLVRILLTQLEIFDCFPDTTNERGSFHEPTFKIRIRTREFGKF